MDWMPGCDTSLKATDSNSGLRLKRLDGHIVHTIGGGPGPAAAANWSTRIDGYLWQHRGATNRSSANFDGNPYYTATENGDRGPGWPAWPLNRPDLIPPMTHEQVVANAKVCAFLHEHHGLPLVPMPNSLPGAKGVGWHRLGIDGNFTGYMYPGRVAGGIRLSSVTGKLCPTDPRITQVIHEIIPMARQMVGLDDGDDMTPEELLNTWIPIDGHPWGGVTVANALASPWNQMFFPTKDYGPPLTQLSPDLARVESKIDAGFAALGDDEANMVGAVRLAQVQLTERIEALPDPDGAVEFPPHLLDQMLTSFVAAVPRPPTQQEMEDAVRRVFGDAAGTEDPQ